MWELYTGQRAYSGLGRDAIIDRCGRQDTWVVQTLCMAGIGLVVMARLLGACLLAMHWHSIASSVFICLGVVRYVVGMRQ